MTEIMSAMHLEIWTEIGLVLFLLLFAGVLVYTFAPRNRATFERASGLPLRGDAVPRRTEGSVDE